MKYTMPVRIEIAIPFWKEPRLYIYQKLMFLIMELAYRYNRNLYYDFLLQYEKEMVGRKSNILCRLAMREGEK